MSQSLRASLDFLPVASQQRLAKVSMGWLVVAVLEAVGYTTLAYAIIHHLSPLATVMTSLLAVIMTVLVSRQGYLTGVKLAADLYHGLGNALAIAKLSWFTQANRNNVSLIATQSIPKLMSVPAHQLQMLIYTPMLPLLLIGGMAIMVDIKLALVAFILLLVSFAIQFYGQSLLGKSDTDRHHTELTSNEATLELVEHLELLRTSAGINETVTRIYQQWQRQENHFDKINHSAAIAIGLSFIASVLPMIGMAGYLLAIDHTLDGFMLAVMMLVARAAAPLEQIALAALGINDLKNLVADYQQLTSIATLKEPDNPATQPKNYDLILKNVTYPPVLHQINLAITYPSRIQIAGSSGSGKTTLLELLLRFDDPASGAILLGDKSLSAYRYNDLMQHIAYVPQEAVIFTGTLADNIRLGKPDATDEQIHVIAEKMQLTAILSRSPEGIYQSVGRQGSALSGGERQRVALARAIIKNAPILILDEATSALDEATEVLIIEQVKQLSCTVIFTTHYHAQIWQANQVIDIG